MPLRSVVVFGDPEPRLREAVGVGLSRIAILPPLQCRDSLQPDQCGMQLMARAAKVTEPVKGKAAKPPATKAGALASTTKPERETSKSAAAVEKPTKAAAAAKSGKVTTAEAAATPAKPAKAPVVSLKQLATELADSGGMSKPEAHMFAMKLIGSVLDHVKAGARVKLAGLGVIGIRDRPARTARNPATGEPVQVAASRKIIFQPAKELKEAL